MWEQVWRKTCFPIIYIPIYENKIKKHVGLSVYLIRSLTNWTFSWDKSICSVDLLPGTAQGNLATGCSTPSSSLLSERHTHICEHTHTHMSIICNSRSGGQDTLCHGRHVTHHMDLNLFHPVDHSNAKTPDEHFFGGQLLLNWPNCLSHSVG